MAIIRIYILKISAWLLIIFAFAAFVAAAIRLSSMEAAGIVLIGAWLLLVIAIIFIGRIMLFRLGMLMGVSRQEWYAIMGNWREFPPTSRTLTQPEMAQDQLNGEIRRTRNTHMTDTAFGYLNRKLIEHDNPPES